MDSIGTIVMGRASFDQMLGLPFPWPGKGKTTVLLTSRAVDSKSLPADVTGSPLHVVSSLDACIDKIQAGFPAPSAASAVPGGTLRKDDVFVFGGPQLMAGLLERGFVDRVTVTVVPVLLGSGMPMLKLAPAPPPAASKAASADSKAATAGDAKESKAAAGSSSVSGSKSVLPATLTLLSSSTFRGGAVQMVYEYVHARPATAAAATDGSAKETKATGH